MARIDISRKTDRAVRACRTPALAADLFATSPLIPEMSRDWSQIAQDWPDIADRKERMLQ